MNGIILSDGFTVSVTGIKLKMTQQFITGFIEFIKKNNWCDILQMLIAYHQQFQQEQQITRTEADRVRVNVMSRLTAVICLRNKDIMTREIFFRDMYIYMYRINIHQFIKNLEEAYSLPREYCRDLKAK